ncbi:MAG: hypothetical protein NVSMB65_15300 [Chloroflexota bacterium]
MASIHTRMPVILRPGDEAAWLDPQLTTPAQALALLCPYPAHDMEALAVSTLVNDVRHEGASVITPLAA